MRHSKILFGKRSICISFFSILMNLSYAQKVSHDDALAYYVKVTKSTKEVFLVMSDMAEKLNRYSITASDFRLDTLQTDSLSKSFNSLISTFRSQTQGLERLNEVDSSINLKGLIINIYKEAVVIFQERVPKLIDILKEGLTKYSKESITNYWKDFLISLSPVFSKTDELEQPVNLFLSKYNIQESELILKGL